MIDGAAMLWLAHTYQGRLLFCQHTDFWSQDSSHLHILYQICKNKFSSSSFLMHIITYLWFIQATVTSPPTILKYKIYPNIAWLKGHMNVLVTMWCVLLQTVLHRSVQIPWQTKCHVLLIIEPGHQLGDNTLASYGPSHFIANTLIQNLDSIYKFRVS